MRRPTALWLTAFIVAACGSESDTPSPTYSEPRMRRLLAKQYTNAVKALLGPAAAAVAQPPPDIASKGFESIGAAEFSPSDTALGDYEASARAIGELVAGDVASLPPVIGCTPSGPTDQACFETFVRSFGRRAFRRPLAEDEVARYVALAVAIAARHHNGYAGVIYTITAFLQSPYFLYQVEVGEPDPDDGGRKRLTSYEMATRMSLFLLDTPPDDALLEVAAAGQLVRPEQIRAKAVELVERPEARDALDAFYEERFKLRALGSLTKDPALFPQFDHALGEAMRTESLLLLRDIVWDQDADYRELLGAPYAFVNAGLARLYGVPAVNTPGFERRTLPAGRRGVLGQASFLAGEAHADSTSPTRRGRFISERILCTEIPPPPPGVVAELPPPVPGMPQTMRQRLEAHAASEACASCHRRMDGLGLGLESFDAIGAFRTQDNGLPIDQRGELVDRGTFEGLDGLGSLIRDLPELHRCWVRSLYRHATGHLEAEGDERSLEEVDASFAGARFRLKQLLIEIVASDAFRLVAKEAP